MKEIFYCCRECSQRVTCFDFAHLPVKIFLLPIAISIGYVLFKVYGVKIAGHSSNTSEISFKRLNFAGFERSTYTGIKKFIC